MSPEVLAVQPFSVCAPGYGTYSSLFECRLDGQLRLRFTPIGSHAFFLFEGEGISASIEVDPVLHQECWERLFEELALEVPLVASAAVEWLHSAIEAYEEVHTKYVNFLLANEAAPLDPSLEELYARECEVASEELVAPLLRRR